MLFNSLDFLLFFPVVTLILFLLPRKIQVPWLVVASCFFYGAFIPKFLLILFFLIAVDFYAALAMEKTSHDRSKRLILILSLVANLAVLFVFKYFNFFNSNLAELFSALHLHYPVPILKLILPIGLSFHTFQSMSYTIEVYRGRYHAEKNILVYALYVLFYPQLVAGPIERPQHLLPQFHKTFEFNFENFMNGLSLMAWGFFKKLFVADRLAVFVAQVFSNPLHTRGGGLSILLGIYFFSFQIYFDFSGYTDIARGAAQVMGIRLMENFNSPYLAMSVGQFWHRWHISLSTWFRDYLYIPLGGNRTSVFRNAFNLISVFLLSGLWHGANWTFLVWGLLHGLYLLLSKATERLSFVNRAPRWIKIFVTFNLVSLAWVYFRAPTLKGAQSVLAVLISDHWKIVTFFKAILAEDNMRLGIYALAFYIIAVVIKPLMNERPSPYVKALAIGLALIIILLGAPLNETAFIYFQF